MDSAVLSASIKAKVIASNPSLGTQLANGGADWDWLFDSIAQAVVEHIQTTAVVTVAVASVSGVTSGVSASGPGSGTGTIT